MGSDTEYDTRMSTVDGPCPGSVMSSFESRLPFCLESFLMPPEHQKYGKKVRKVGPGDRSKMES